MDPTAFYRRTVLFQTEHFEVVSCDWSKNALSESHSHGWSQCYALVESGCFENTTDFGLKSETNLFEPGQVMVTPVSARHSIRCVSNAGKTLHVYVPRVSPAHSPRFSSPQKEILAQWSVQSAGQSWSDLVRLLGQVQEQCVSTDSVFFMNQLFSGVLPETFLAEEILNRTKTTLATQEASAAFAQIEREVIAGLAKQIGWDPEQSGGASVPGGSAANFTALHCARHRRFPTAKLQGTGGAKLKVFASEDAHYSIRKAAMVLGLGTQSVVKIRTDAMGRMDIDDLRAQIRASLHSGEIPLMVCATAGTTVYGAFDPLTEIAKECREFGIWLHVDGAWGGAALFSEKVRHLVHGIENADSVSMDAHKLFGASLTSSFLVTRDPEILLQANDVSGGEYLFHGAQDVVDRGKLSWQCGRSADAFSFWTLWRSVGTQGLGAFVDRLIALQKEITDWVREQPRLELVKDPTFLNLCVRVKPPINRREGSNWSRHVRQKLIDTNKAMVNFSEDKEGGSFLRLVLAHPRIDRASVESILQAALEVE
jgi:glutamate/tyrosine decarboxylase-like PLP-dependent enzyme